MVPSKGQTLKDQMKETMSHCTYLQCARAILSRSNRWSMHYSPEIWLLWKPNLTNNRQRPTLKLPFPSSRDRTPLQKLIGEAKNLPLQLKEPRTQHFQERRTRWTRTKLNLRYKLAQPASKKDEQNRSPLLEQKKQANWAVHLRCSTADNKDATTCTPIKYQSCHEANQRTAPQEPKHAKLQAIVYKL